MWSLWYILFFATINMSREFKMLLRGVGVGFIIAAAFFYMTYFAVRHSGTLFIDDNVVIERARELGMDYIEDEWQFKIIGILKRYKCNYK